RAQKLELPPENVLRKQVLERLILQQVEMQHAEHAGIKVPDEALNSALQEVAQRNGLTLSQLPDTLASQGIDYTTYRDQMRRELTLTLLRQRDVLQHITVTPREIDQYLEREAKHPSGSTEYNLSHILIAIPENATPAQLQQAGERAQDVYRRAKAGEDFAKLAIAYSNSQTALEGGALGWLKGPALPTFLADVVPRMKPGDVSDVMQTGSGFHIVRLNEVRTNTATQIIKQTHLRHILLKTSEVEDDATVQQKLATMRAQILAGTADFAVLAKTSSADPGSAVEGGDLGWTPLETFVPEFARQADALKDGEISEPFKTQYGWHIVQMLGRRDFDNTATAEREQAFGQLRESRVDEATEIWLQQLRDEAYVELRL
ncbi:MAG: peptidylprolyl isomerase, partial [Steroidobacteraceae bacterium]